MGARKKLNSAHVCGSVLVAGGIGLLTGSWTIFGVSLAIILVLNIYDGSIRPRR
jgi:hypothetical protein